MTRFFILVTLLSTLLFSDNDIDIDSYIEKIKKSSPETRVQLMNEFKQKVAQMNKEERLKSIQQIQEKMRANSVQQDHTNMQTQHINEINIYQNMNHKQVTSKIEYEGNPMDSIKHKEHR